MSYHTSEYIISELLNSLKDALNWIDTVPQETVLPVMPGFDRDEVNILIDESQQYLLNNLNGGCSDALLTNSQQNSD